MTQDNLNGAADRSSEEALRRLFTLPEGPGSALSVMEQKLSQNLAGFLRENIVAIEKPLAEIERDFAAHEIPEVAASVSDYAEEMMRKLVAHSVHTSSPNFIGHMTSALPNFLLPLSKMLVGLNQNVVKVETSKAFTPLERQVLGMIHHLVYRGADEFYQRWMHDANHALGAFCSGGTIANVTALWVARNRLLRADGGFRGVAEEGLYRAFRHYGFEGLAIVVSERGHYSLGKAANVLGLGAEALVPVKCDARNKVDIAEMRRTCAGLRARKIGLLAVVGVAGTTETGSVDALNEIAAIAAEFGCHFHVDAAWGGATLMSAKHAHLLQGIERADSVTIDAHKQLYVPLGAGLVVFKDPAAAHAIEHHSEYVLRRGSKDLGTQTLEGSRAGMAMLVHACLQVIGRRGYETLIDRSIEKARFFAELIRASEDFELISEPELCLLTYRYVPAAAVRRALASATVAEVAEGNELLNGLTRFIQRKQREEGRSFVSRTRLNPEKYQRQEIGVFRVVLANPLTTEQVLREVLVEQRRIAEAEAVYGPKLVEWAKRWGAR